MFMKLSVECATFLTVLHTNGGYEGIYLFLRDYLKLHVDQALLQKCIAKDRDALQMAAYKIKPKQQTTTQEPNYLEETDDYSAGKW